MKKAKIAIYIDNSRDPITGGASHYQFKLINTLLRSYTKDHYDLVLLLRQPSDYYRELANSSASDIIYLNLDKITIRMLARIIIKALSIMVSRDYILPFYRYLYKKEKERHLFDIVEKYKIDFIYYVKQAICLSDKIPFIATNWDLGHVTGNVFPEINSTFQSRSNYYKESLPKAVMIFTESESGKKEIEDYLNIPKERIKVVNLFGSDVVKIEVSERIISQFMQKHSIVPQRYFFYPAQFWTHKNHYTLIKAFKLLTDDITKYKDIKLVLVGDEKNNINFIIQTIKELNLLERVLLLGYVTNEEINILYRNAIALVMPTFLGPTNMPIIESLALKCPIICSDLEGHKEIAGDAALYFNPTEFGELYVLMKKLLIDTQLRKKMVKKGEERYTELDFKIENTIKLIDNYLTQLARLKGVWK